MPSTRNTVHAWLARGKRSRLFLCILLLIISFAGASYYLLIDTAVSAAHERLSRQLPLAQHYLLPVLAQAEAQGDTSGLQRLIDTELQSNPDLASIHWQSGPRSFVAHNPQPLRAAYPSWFAKLAPLAPVALRSEPADTAAGVLTLQSNPMGSINRIWHIVAHQLWVSGAILLTMLLILALVLRATDRTLRRMQVATEQFQNGDHSTRMAVNGSTEAQALARVFNAMAAEVQDLVQTLTHTRAALRGEKERAEVTLASIGDAVITTSLEGQIDTLNAVAEQLTGWTQQQARGRPLDEVFQLQDETSWFSAQGRPVPLYQTDSVVHATNQLRSQPASAGCAIEYTAAPIRQADGSAVGCVLVFRDVSEKHELIQEISWQVGHDVLTGLHNRAALQEPFKLAMLQARHQQKLLAVCLLDLDHFQPINAHYGSAYGDRLLQSVAQRLVAFAGEDHELARLGGDEFVLLLRDQSDLAQITQQLGEVQAALSSPYQVDHQTIHLTASIGIAIYPRDDMQQGVNLDTLLRQADQAMYQAKQTGRNRLHVFDAQHDQQVQTHHDLRSRIAQALQDGELRLYYQPKVNMRSGQVIGMEALLRWQHPEQGIVGPYHFLPLVENTDLIIDIGEWVLHQALQQMQRWAEQGLHWVTSVNIAARHFQQPDFVARLGAILALFPQVSPATLELEILESAALEDVQHMRNVMASCQQLGVQFALDDFGTGYSSLAYLKRLPANTLKIDQAFVRDMLEDPDDLTLVDAIVGLAKAFDRQVIAEGVETVEHGLLLLQLGCDLAQGYGIARPMPAAAVAPWAASFMPAEAWHIWGTTQWEQADFPLLLAEHEHRAWVARIASQPAQEVPATAYPAGFGNWYAQRGQSHYGHLPAFAQLGPVLQELRAQGLALVRLQAENKMLAFNAGLPRLLDLQTALATHLTALLSVAAAEKAD